MAVCVTQPTPILGTIVIHLHELPELAAGCDRQEWVMQALATILHTTDQPMILAWTVQAGTAGSAHSFRITPIASMRVPLPQAWLILQALCHYQQIAAIDVQVVME